MRVSYNWLREFVEVNISPEALAEKLTGGGLEVESVEAIKPLFRGVIVGEIEAIRPHPHASRLSLCRVEAGGRRLDIVCGAKNIEVGQKVPLAVEGALLPPQRVIKGAEIRGVFSQGMLCSEKELGLGEDHQGIMILPEDLPSGENLEKLLPLEDAILDLEITPNRGDCLSILGVAREIAVLLGKPLRLPSFQVKEKGRGVEKLARVEVEDKELCPRYTARIIEGVKISPSPFWLQCRLKNLGIKSLNNVVDITNYVMMELGQPLHAFDYHKLKENRIVVRKFQEGEEILSLDGVWRKCRGDMLAIADAEKAVAIAGVMGGEETQITPDTTTILLESAYFQPQSIRRTSRALGLTTEASYRFERGVDFEGVIPASNRASFLISELAGGKVSRGIIDVSSGTYRKTWVSLRPSRVNRVLGTRLTSNKMEGVLRALGFGVKREKGKMEVEVPSFRGDISREIDLIEEIARIKGYDNLPLLLRAGRCGEKREEGVEKMEEFCRDFLTASGLREVINYSLLGRKVLERTGWLNSQLLEVTNPLSEEQRYLRPSLLPSLLETFSRNLSRGNPHMAIFELGRIYRRKEESPWEHRSLAIGLMGLVKEPSWDRKGVEADFFELKGIIEGLVERLGIEEYHFQRGGAGIFNQEVQASLVIRKSPVGILGEVEDSLRGEFEINRRVFLAELDFEKLVKFSHRDIKFRPLPLFPSVDRDISLMIKDTVPAQDIIRVIREKGKGLVEEIRLFDVYYGKHIPSGYVGLSFTLTYRSPSRTLTDEEVNRLHKGICQYLEKSLELKIR